MYQVNSKLQDDFLEWVSSLTKKLVINIQENTKEWIISLSVLLVLFRFPIFALLGLKEWGRLTIFFPLMAVGIPLFQSFPRGISQRRISQLGLATFAGGLLMLAFTFYLLGVGDMAWDEVRSIFFFKIVGLIFLALTLMAGFSAEAYSRMVNIICWAVLVFGGGFSVVEALLYKYSYFDQSQIASVLLPASGHIEGWTLGDFSFDHRRVMGFCLGPHESAFAILAAWIYLIERGFKNFYVAIGATLFAFWAIIESGSFTVIITVAIYGAYKLFQNFSISKVKRYSPLGLAALAVTVFGVSKSPFVKRWEFYSIHWDWYYRILSPTFQECHAVPLIGKAPMGTNCDIPEMKFFAPTFHYGLITHLPYYVFVLLPFIRLAYGPRLSSRERILSVVYFILIASLFHYPAIEKWGQNYFFFLIVAGLIQSIPIFADDSVVCERV